MSDTHYANCSSNENKTKSPIFYCVSAGNYPSNIIDELEPKVAVMDN